MIKTVRFFPDARPPRPPLAQLLAQVVSEPAGVSGMALADWWLAVGSPGNFSRALLWLQADGWIAAGADGRWRPTAAAWAACVVLVDEVPEQQPGEDDQAFAARCEKWQREPPGFVLQ